MGVRDSTLAARNCSTSLRTATAHVPFGHNLMLLRAFFALISALDCCANSETSLRRNSLAVTWLLRTEIKSSVMVIASTYSTPAISSCVSTVGDWLPVNAAVRASWGIGRLGVDIKLRGCVRVDRRYREVSRGYLLLFIVLLTASWNNTALVSINGVSKFVTLIKRFTLAIA